MNPDDDEENLYESIFRQVHALQEELSEVRIEKEREKEIAVAAEKKAKETFVQLRRHLSQLTSFRTEGTTSEREMYEYEEYIHTLLPDGWDIWSIVEHKKCRYVIGPCES